MMVFLVTLAASEANKTSTYPKALRVSLLSLEVWRMQHGGCCRGEGRDVESEEKEEGMQVFYC